MLKEFKEFALKGNVMDMAIGVIIAGAFGKIVTALVNGIFMPILGYLLAGVSFTDLKVVLAPAEVSAAGEIIKPEAAILYGQLIQVTIDFILIALVIFAVVKVLNNMRRKEETVEEPAGPTEADLLTEIRDLLKK